MKCINCNKENIEGTVYCTNCGALLNVAEVKPETQDFVQSNNTVNLQGGIGNAGPNINNIEQVPVQVDQSNNTVNLQGGIENIEPNINNIEQVPVQVDQPELNSVKPETQSSLENKSERNPKKKILLILIPIILILLVVGIAISIILYKTSSTYAYKNLVSTIGKEINNSFEKKESSNVSFELSPEISGSGNADFEKIINKVSLKFDSSYDSKNNKALVGLIANYNSKSLLDLAVQYDKDSYIFLNNLYDKPIKVESNNLSDEIDADKIDEENVKIVVNGLVGAINKSFKKDYFTKDEQTITINDKSQKVKAISLSLNKEQYKEFSKSISNYLKNDKDFVSAYAKITNSKESEVIEDLEEDISDFDSDNIKLTIYTMGLFNKFVGMEVKQDDTLVKCIVNSENDFDITIESSMTVKVNVKLNKTNNKINLKDTANAVDVNSLDNTALTTILNNLKKVDGYSDLNTDLKETIDVSLDELISSISSLTSSSYDDYDYDYYNYGDY